MSGKTCSIGGCDKPRKARGWCNGHYARWMKHGDPGDSPLVQYGQDYGPTCSIEGCNKAHTSLGFCSRHYWAFKQHGDPLKAKPAPARRNYTEHELGIISDESLSAAEVADLIGLRTSSVIRLRHQLRHGEVELTDWVDSEIDFMIDSAGRMPIKKIAQFMGREYDQVKAKLRLLESKGFAPKRPELSLNPNVVAGRTLLAKTCKKCGLLLEGQWFTRHKRDGSYNPDCRECQSNRKRDTPEKRAKANEYGRQYTAAAQAYTLERAENNGKEWTDRELVVLADPSKTTFQKAIELKRTFHAVHVTASRHGLVSKRPDFDAMKNGAWRISWEITEMAAAS